MIKLMLTEGKLGDFKEFFLTRGLTQRISKYKHVVPPYHCHAISHHHIPDSDSAIQLGHWGPNSNSFIAPNNAVTLFSYSNVNS